MSKKQQTRERIVDTALKHSVEVGLEGLSFGKVAELTGLSKSGLFAHFSSKEHMQEMVLEEATERFMALVVLPAQKVPAGLQRLEAYFTHYLDWIGGHHEAGGCPFITYVQEFDDRPGPVRDRLVQSQQEWREVLIGQARAAQADGAMPPSVDPDQLVFELIGLALSYQVASRLLGQSDARARAVSGFRRLLT